MRKMIYALILVATFVAVGQAQEKASDTAKVAVMFTNLSVDAGGVQNSQGINGTFQFKLYGYEGVKLEAVGDFGGYFNSGSDNFYTYLAGPQIGINVRDGRFNPFANVKFGVLRIAGTNFYAHSVGGGLDFNVSNHFGVRAIQYDHVSVEGAPRFERISTGVYFRP
jgi:hypothetical protein